MSRLGFLLLPALPALAGTPRDLQVGIAGHAFDHLGNIGEQAEAAAASGSTIIYATGLGGDGYLGLPAPAELEAQRKSVAAYVRQAKARGIRLALGYVCATSIVKLESFDRNWAPELRSRFATPPAQWLQRDAKGQPLPSWYGGDYRPACMNNPEWRLYQEFIVRLQIESGHDGIFFDNPTVHPQGCYCEHCMRKFSEFLAREGQRVEMPATNSLAFLRQLAQSRPADFMRFRCTTARDFMAQMRVCARRVKPGALMTCNNSLNAPEAFYSQCRSYAYNIHEMSEAEDLVVVEDMSTQPRMLADGRMIEYGPVYGLIEAISRGKPVVAVTIADGDYHTPPNLVRLAMAEAAAHEASYLLWPTWPENVRAGMCAAIRPQADLLRNNAQLLNGTRPRTDVLFFLPFRQWLDTADCPAWKTALALSRANVQFDVVSEDHFATRLREARGAVLLLESPALLLPAERAAVSKFEAGGGQVATTGKESWLGELHGRISRPSINMQAPPSIRAVVRDQGRRTIVHLLNLNVRRLSSFEDKVTPASDVGLHVRVPFKKVRQVRLLTADEPQQPATVPFTTKPDQSGTVVMFKIGRLAVSALAVIE
jgi:hypothetical protein